MPVPKAMLDPMLGSFRGMMQEVEAKGLSGPPVEAMRAALGRMEALGQEHHDLSAFQGQVMQEDLFASALDSPENVQLDRHLGRLDSGGVERGLPCAENFTFQ